nr:unnamed protein product [Digitaria exilis]
MSGDENDVDHETRRRRLLFERFMASCSPGSPYLFVEEKERAGPCVIYSMRMSIKKAEAFWSHRSSRRFFPERRGSFPILICRVVGPDDHIEPVMLAQSGAPGGEPPRPGVISGNFEERYYYIQLYRENGMLHKDGSPAPWKEVAVIRGMPGGRGITVTSHVKRLALRLHDFLFMLCGISATVDLRFSEKWFRLPAGWTEERLYAEDGSHIVDIGASVENLVKKLWDLRDEEEQEMEKRKKGRGGWMRRRLQEEEERRKIRERNEEKDRRRREEIAAMRPVHPPMPWDATLWSINEAHCVWYSKFKLSMDSNKKVSCHCVGKESLEDMLRRVDNFEHVLPISETAASSSAIETLGFVECDSVLEILGYGPKRDRLIDRSGRLVSSMVMVSRSVEKVLIFRVFVQKLDIVMDDGTVMSCCPGFAVNFHCDDISSSELLTLDWAYHILCKNIDSEGRTSFSTLLAHLKKKLQLELTEEELELYNMSVIDGEEENEDLAEPLRKMKEWIPPEPKPE